MGRTVGQAFSIASATVSDCSECAGLLVEQLGEHCVDMRADQLSEVLEGVVADETRGFLLAASN